MLLFILLYVINQSNSILKKSDCATLLFHMLQRLLCSGYHIDDGEIIQLPDE